MPSSPRNWCVVLRIRVYPWNLQTHFVEFPLKSSLGKCRILVHVAVIRTVSVEVDWGRSKCVIRCNPNETAMFVGHKWLKISHQMSNGGRAVKPFGGIFCVIINSTAMSNKAAELYLRTEILFHNIVFCRKQDKQVDKQHKQCYLFGVYFCKKERT